MTRRQLSLDMTTGEIDSRLEDAVIDHLLFANYVANRRAGCTPEQFAKHVAIDADAYERRYQELKRLKIERFK